MSDPKEKAKNIWEKTIARLFNRNKNNPKQKKEVTSKDRDNRAFVISLVIGILMLLSFILYLFARSNEPLNFFDLGDVRVQTGLLGLACFVSAWLSRRGRTPIGMGLILAVLYLFSFLTALKTAGGGIVLASVSLGITLAITSAVMEPALARWVNIVGILIGAMFILLDVFEPFVRPADPTPTASLITQIFLLGTFAVLIVRRFNTYNLRTKLIIAFIGVTVIPLLAITYYDNLKLSDTLYQGAQEILGRFASQTALQVDTFIDDQTTSIKTQSQNPLFEQFLAISPEQRNGTKEQSDASDALNVLAANADFINRYMLVDNKGAVALNTRSDQDEYSASPFFKDALAKNAAIVVGPLIDQKTRAASLYFSAPVKSKTGAILGVLVAEYNANVIESITKSLIPEDNPKRIFLHIVDENTFVRIADTNDPELQYKSYKDFTPAEIAQLQNQGLLMPGSTQDVLAVETETLTGLQNLNQSPFFTTNVDKTLATKNLNSGTYLKNMPWMALVQQSEAEVLTPLAQQKRTTALVFILLLVLITLAAFGLSQLLASPILKLAATAQKIAAGDLSLQSDIESNDEIGVLAGAFNEMTRQTRALIDSLEQRSKALATSSEVSRRISTILDQQQLVTEVVKQVQGAFNYYHAHIYLLDEKTQELIMAGGTGEAGRAMLARGHKIPVGKGLVGRAAQNNVTVLVTDVAQDPQWLPNPLLPDTKSEVAVPISIAEKVLGVLDVQHNVAGVLKQEDVDVLQSIANQVAFAVRNARSYSEVEAKADREALITSIGQKIQGTITVEGALQVAIREIGRALNGAKTQIVLSETSTPSEDIQQH